MNLLYAKYNGDFSFYHNMVISIVGDGKGDWAGLKFMTEKNQVYENGKDFPDFHVSGQQVKAPYFHRWDNFNNLPKITEVVVAIWFATGLCI